MLEELAAGRRKAVGFKRACKALEQGQALVVYLAQDADQELKVQLTQLAQVHSVRLVAVPTMQELGRVCGIQVPAAAAALLKG